MEATFYDVKIDQNKNQTRLVNHQHGFSTFQESLQLEFNMSYDESKGVYEDKNTQIVAIIMYEGKIKSGGYAKYNIAEVLNKRLNNKSQTIALTQCPDPNANVEVTFTYQLVEDALADTTSILNASSRDLNMSRINFNDDKISLQMDRINETINKFNELSTNIKEKKRQKGQQVPQLIKKLQIVEGEKEILDQTVKKLERELEKKLVEYNQNRKKDQKALSQMQKQLQRKNKQIKSREFIEIDEDKKYQQMLAEKQKQIHHYRTLYESTLNELQEIRSSETNMRGSLGFAKMEVEDVHQIAKFEPEKDVQRQNIQIELKRLKAENADLQGNVASMSYKLAQLFNASFDFGGAKLLDYLQTAIGLTEF